MATSSSSENSAQQHTLFLAPHKSTTTVSERPSSRGSRKRSLSDAESDQSEKRFSPILAADRESVRMILRDDVKNDNSLQNTTRSESPKFEGPSSSRGRSDGIDAQTEINELDRRSVKSSQVPDLFGDRKFAVIITRPRPSQSEKLPASLGDTDGRAKKIDQTRISKLRLQGFEKAHSRSSSSENSSNISGLGPNRIDSRIETPETTMPLDIQPINNFQNVAMDMEDEPSLAMLQNESTADKPINTASTIPPGSKKTSHPKAATTLENDPPRTGVATAVSQREGSAEQSSSKTFNAELFNQAPKPQKMVWWTRRSIQNLEKRLNAEGPRALTPSDFESIKKKLTQLSYYDFNKDKEFFGTSKIAKAVKLLTDRKKYGDDMAEMATELYTRWMSGNLGIAPLNSAVFEDIEDDAAESEDYNDGPAGTGRVGFQRPSAAARQLMVGVISNRNVNGRLVNSLDPNYGDKKGSDVFGHNDLTVGQWWPYQICALRDGAHGSFQGGIYGRDQVGTFSIVTSAESKYSDRDEGDVLYYSGSYDDPANDQDTAPQLTKNTRFLLKSIHTRKPIRVIRKGPGKKNSFYPRAGYRYDGLYRVTNYEIKSGREGQRDYYRFRLERCPGQVPLTDPSIKGHPSKSEYEMFMELTTRNL